MDVMAPAPIGGHAIYIIPSVHIWEHKIDFLTLTDKVLICKIYTVRYAKFAHPNEKITQFPLTK
jgi:hypothetical protein